MFEKMQRHMHRFRDTVFPPSPKDAEEIQDLFNDGTKKDYMLDATFKIVPHSIFKQFLIIHISYRGKVSLFYQLDVKIFFIIHFPFLFHF